MDTERKILIITIIGLFLIFIGTGLHMAIKRQNLLNEKILETESNVAFDTNSDEIKNLIKNLTTAFDLPCGFYEYFTKEKYSYQDLSNESAFRIAIIKIYNAKKSLNVENPFAKNSRFTAKEIKEELTKLFPSTYKFINQNFTFSCLTFNYDETSNEYIVSEEESCEKSCAITNSYLIESAIKHNKTLEITMRVAFVDSNNLTTIKYYRDYKLTEPLKEIKNSEEVKNKTLLTESDYKKSSLYRLTFDIENKNYLFNKAELITNS